MHCMRLVLRPTLKLDAVGCGAGVGAWVHHDVKHACIRPIKLNRHTQVAARPGSLVTAYPTSRQGVRQDITTKL